jgi:hypothetical protein
MKWGWARSASCSGRRVPSLRPGRIRLHASLDGAVLLEQRALVHGSQIPSAIPATHAHRHTVCVKTVEAGSVVLSKSA